MMCLQVETVPSAYITVNKGRKKIKQDKYVYLKNGQEFQIELFNPTTDTLLAKISINNKLISYSGIVLRPGERVFLERYIDVPKKFLFDTYEVSGDSSAVQKAIEKNGLVKVQFFKEDDTPNITLNNFNTNNGTYIYRSDTNKHWGDFTTFTCSDSLTFGTTTSNSSFSYTTPPEVKASLSKPKPEFRKLRSKKTETGRVEKGSNSEQSFTTVDKKFFSYAFRTIEYQIKPVSQQRLDTKQVTSKYCTGCGKKGKPAHKFCSNCGTKL